MKWRGMAQGISLSADSDLEGTCPLRESVLHLGACRLRRQIFREMKGKTEEILCGFPSIFLKYLGKDASKMRANRCKAGSKTSPAALSWSSLFGATVLKSFRFRTMLCVVCFCRDTACRVRRFQQNKNLFSYQRIFRWKRSAGTFPKLWHSKRDTGRSGLVRSALEKLPLFSPTFSARQKHGAGDFAVCGQRLRRLLAS